MKAIGTMEQIARIVWKDLPRKWIGRDERVELLGIEEPGAMFLREEWCDGYRLMATRYRLRQDGRIAAGSEWYAVVTIDRRDIMLAGYCTGALVALVYDVLRRLLGALSRRTPSGWRLYSRRPR